MANNGVERGSVATALMRRGRARTALLWLLVLSASIAASSQELPISPRATFPGAPAGSGPYTTNNDDSCDITVQPAATLLLPYFEVDIRRTQFPWDQRADTTFAITNTTDLPQIVKVQTWTDYGTPLFSYNLFLTGYDVQRVSLREILTRGTLPDALSNAPVGERSQSGNPNHFGTAAADCSAHSLVFDEERLRETRRALTNGEYYTISDIASRRNGMSGDMNRDFSLTAADPAHLVDYLYGEGPESWYVDSNDDGRASIADAFVVASYLSEGGPKPYGARGFAVGYLTADVVATCGGATPLDDSYFTSILLYDNVLMGDYQMVDPGVLTGNWSISYDMVHIRAIPEGGAAGEVVATNLPYTFYDMYVPSAGLDRRQPLPNTFATRYFEAEPAFGISGSELMIWREGVRPSATALDAPQNANVPLVEIVRFDEGTNPTTLEFVCEIAPCPPPPVLTTPVASVVSVDDVLLIPADYSGSSDLGGWLYLNLNNGGPQVAATFRTSSQNWVVSRWVSEGRYATDFPAIPLGNGCSPDPGEVDPDLNPLAPAPNTTP